jgi:hypothetical protein
VRPQYDGTPADSPDKLCVDVVGDLPRCMDLISAEDVIRAIEVFFVGGAVRFAPADDLDQVRRFLST